jgi:hypothetical protein
MARLSDLKPFDQGQWTRFLPSLRTPAGDIVNVYQAVGAPRSNAEWFTWFTRVGNYCIAFEKPVRYIPDLDLVEVACLIAPYTLVPTRDTWRYGDGSPE